MHGIEEAERRGRRRGRWGPPLIVAVLVAVVSMALAGPALAAAPTILSESVSNLTATDAILNASIEDKAAPDGALFQFQLVANPSEYQTTFDCPPEWERTSVCLKMPERGEHSGTLPYGITKAGLAEAPVSQDVAKARDFGNLTPNTTYHYRVIAASDVLEEDFINWETPIVFGPDQTFTTPAAPPSPRYFSNGLRATTKHEGVLAFGPMRLHGGYIENLECEEFFAGSAWNQVQEGTERGFLQTTGYGTWDCTAAAPVKIKNTKGETVEGIYGTAEGPPETKTEKAHKTGSTSLPWTGELTEKEGGKFLLTHQMKVWIVVPLCTEMGGTGVGGGCLVQGNEFEYKEEEGATEKAAGDELEPKWVNGTRNGLSPSKLVSGGEKEGTEKKGQPETGRLESSVGPGYITGTLAVAGSTNFELITAK